MAIDFSEWNKNGDDLLESMTREILERKGLKEIIRSGKGPDKGKDIRFREELEGSLSKSERVWIVDCKFKSNPKKSVAPSNFETKDFTRTIKRNEADAFLLVTNTRPSTNLQEDIIAVKRNDKNLYAKSWDGAQIEQELYNCLDIFKKYLPQNYRNLIESRKSQAKNFLNQYPEISGNFSSSTPVIDSWHAYVQGKAEGNLSLSGKKTRILYLKSTNETGFSVGVPRGNLLGYITNYLKFEFKSNKPIALHLFVRGENGQYYYLTYETLNGQSKQSKDGQGMDYAYYPIGQSLNDDKWHSIERDLNTDLERFYKTRPLLVERLAFNVIGEVSFRKIQFLHKK